jgi:hypothetical protein
MPTRVLLSAPAYRGTGRFVRGVLAAASCVLLGACFAAPAQPAGAGDGVASGVQQPTEAPSVTNTPVVMGAPAAMVEAALDDATRRSGQASSAIKVVSAGSVTWSDGSLGCPEPGMLYTQALVPGYRIVVQAGEQRLEYHAGTRGQPKFCPADKVIPPVPVGAGGRDAT